MAPVYLSLVLKIINVTFPLGFVSNEWNLIILIKEATNHQQAWQRPVKSEIKLFKCQRHYCLLDREVYLM